MDLSVTVGTRDCQSVKALTQLNGGIRVSGLGVFAFDSGVIM